MRVQNLLKMSPRTQSRPVPSASSDQSVSVKAPVVRIPLLAAGLLVLLAAVWAGWIRIGWPWPAIQPTLPISHGPLMVSGFLGTLISLERAVALRRRWPYLSPLFSALGGLALVIGVPGIAGPLLIALGSLGLLAIFVVILRTHIAWYTAMMALGSLAWLAGNLLWLSGRPIYQVVAWWAVFLIFTIAGERLELGRLIRLPRKIEILFLGISLVIVMGLVLSIWVWTPGTRLASVGILALGLWLLRFDIARRTIHKPGLPRFAAVCLLIGFVWLVFAGSLGLIYGIQPAGPRYDAFLHAIFLGYVFSMIFGHAPIIFPAILGLPVKFHRVFYVHLALLHLSLLLRITGDLFYNPSIRLWGGLLNGIAILLFLVATAVSLRQGNRSGKMKASVHAS